MMAVKPPEADHSVASKPNEIKPVCRPRNTLSRMRRMRVMDSGGAMRAIRSSTRSNKFGIGR